jgi:hypothetical protein
MMAAFEDVCEREAHHGISSSHDHGALLLLLENPSRTALALRVFCAPVHEASSLSLESVHHTGGGIVAVVLNRNLGMTLLAVYLILVGISGLVSLALPLPLLAILALLAGVFIIMGR